MRRPANHALYNKLRPSEVGLEADKPEVLKEGESYFATDTYRIYYGGKSGHEPFISEGFPYHKLRGMGTDLMFRLFLDPLLGNDDNDGLTWDTAKATVSGCYAELPQDMKGFGCVICAQSGTIEDNVKSTNNNAPWIVIQKLDTWLNDAIPEGYLSQDRLDFYLAGKSSPIRDDDPLVIKTADPSKNLMELRGTNTNWEFVCFDYRIGHWASGFCHYDGIILESTSTEATNKQLMITTGSGCRVAACGVGIKSAYIDTVIWEGEFDKGQFSGIHIYEGFGQAFTNPGTWKAIFAFRNHSANAKLELGKWNGSKVGWDTVYKPTTTTAQFVIDANCGLFSDLNDTNPGLIIDIDSNDLQFDGTGTPRVATLGESFKGTVGYNSDQMTLVDGSLSPRVIKDYKTGETTQYLTPRIYSAGDNVMFDLPTSDPTVAGALWNDAGTVKVSTG